MTHQTAHTPPGAPAGTLPALSHEEQETWREAGEQIALLHRTGHLRGSEQLALLPPDHLPGLELTPLGARVTGPVDRDAVIARLRLYRGFGASWRWLMGDLVCSLAADHDGDLAYAWQLVADEDLDTRSSLSRSVAVARMVPLARRRPGLSWSHHEAVLAADPRRQHSPPIEEGDDRDLLLERADAERWTVDQLERHIGERAAPDQDPLPDMPAKPPWRLPAFAAALDRVLGSHPAAVVRADGTVVAFDADVVRAIIDTEGVEA